MARSAVRPCDLKVFSHFPFSVCCTQWGKFGCFPLIHGIWRNVLSSVGYYGSLKSVQSNGLLGMEKNQKWHYSRMYLSVENPSAIYFKRSISLSPIFLNWKIMSIMLGSWKTMQHPSSAQKYRIYERKYIQQPESKFTNLRGLTIFLNSDLIFLIYYLVLCWFSYQFGLWWSEQNDSKIHMKKFKKT